MRFAPLLLIALIAVLDRREAEAWAAERRALLSARATALPIVAACLAGVPTVHADCAHGQFPDLHGLLCRACPNGWYGLDGLECIPCESGQFQNESGQTSCHQCAAGQSAESAVSNGCTSCDSGKYQNENTSTAYNNCKDCPDGWYQGDPGKGLCIQCNAGEAAPDAKTKCVECEPGRYQDESPSTNWYDCDACPRGYTQPNEGGDICNECSKGKYQKENVCVDWMTCDAGLHRDGGNSSKDVNCVEW
jgi:hypothetical protein